MAKKYTRKQIEKIIMKRTGGDDPGWLTDADIKKINGLARNPSIGGVYPAWVYVNKTEKEPNRNPNRLYPTVTAEEVQNRFETGTGKTITIKKAQDKADKENSTNATVDFWADSMAMSIPTSAAIGLLVKVGAKPLAKILANPTVRNALSEAAKRGAKIPPQLARATKELAEKVGYQVAGRLPRPSTPQGAFNSDMARIARGMDRGQAKPTAVEPVRAPAPFSEVVPEITIPRTSGGRFAQGQPKPPGWAGRPKTDQADFGALTPRPQPTAKPSTYRNLSERQAAVRPSTAPTRSALPGPRSPLPQATGGGRALPRGVRRYSPERGPNITSASLAASLAAAKVDDLNASQLAVLEEAAMRDWEPESEEQYFPEYDALPEGGPSELDIGEESRVSPEEQIAEPGFGRMLGLRRSAREIERDVAITEALDAGDYDKVAELEKHYGPAPVEDSLTQRTKDYTPEQIEAMLSPEVSGSPVDELKELFSGFEATGDTSSSPILADQDQYYKHGGKVKSKKKKSKPRKVSKAYSNQTRKPSRA